MIDVWAEKYRPSSLNEVVGQEAIVKRLKSFVKTKSLPHLMFAGPAGTGKTTCALAIAKELYGDNWHVNLLETNASDERGIDVIRGKIKDFARTMPLGDVSFKLVLLDEADALTKEAQHALRRTMEKYAGNVRFILDCNFSSKIIDPIQSRCAVFRFKPLAELEIINYIKKVASSEGLEIDDNALRALYTVSFGDCRKAVNIIQSCASLTKSITESVIFEAASYARPAEINNIISLALKGDFIKSKDLMTNLMLKYGLSGIDAVKQIQSHVINLDLPNELKVKLIDRIGEYEFRMVEGSDEFLQIEALLAQFCLIGKGA